MKKIYLLLLLLIVTSLLLVKVILVSAYSFEDTNEFLTNTATLSGYEEEQKDTSVIVAGIIKTALTLVGTIFIILIIYSGVVWMTSGSNSEKVTKARKIMIYSAVGLLIILTAYSITYFIASNLSGPTSNQGGAPLTCAQAGGLCNPSCGGYTGTHSVGRLDCPASTPNCCVTGN